MMHLYMLRIIKELLKLSFFSMLFSIQNTDTVMIVFSYNLSSNDKK